MAPEPLQDAIAAALAGRISRRIFMARALAAGLSTTAAASLLAACGIGASSPSAGTPRPSVGTPRPSASASGKLPEIVPTPHQVTYGALAEMGPLACCACPEGSLRDRLAEIADDAGISLSTDTTCGSQSTLTITLEESDLPPQGYRLSVAPASHGADIHLWAIDEAGAFFGLASLAQLVVRRADSTSVRQATVSDWPSFERRGLILDPPWLEVLRFGVPYKLNFLAVASGLPPPSRPGVAEMIAYCRSHQVEVMSMLGYRDALTDAPMASLKSILTTQLDLGVRSFCLKWDDIGVDDPASMAATHARIFNELYDHLRLLDHAAKVSIVMPPYGGVPPDVFFGEAGMRYLALMKERLPADVVVFWTGSGIFSQAVTTAGAAAYRSLAGHPIGLWDNDALRFAGSYRPLSGRAGDLASVVSTYMANMNSHEMAWTGANGYFALLTELQYAWRAESYDAGVACTVAERELHARGLWVPPGSTCAPAGASWTPGVIPSASPMDIASASPAELPSG